MIIGLTGKNGSGKGEVAKFLKGRGFFYFSLSDEIREELKSRKEEITRDNLIRAGNELRSTYGPSILAERILARLDPDKNYAIDSFRNPLEVAAFKRRGNFVLLAVCAEARRRFERVRMRGRENDPQTFEDFLKKESVEEADSNTGQQLTKTEALADVRIENNGPLAELHEKVKEVLVRAVSQFARPNWDEYFMGIARMVALRSNCVKRKVAAVIVKDKRIISTGYNGTPRGVKNCNEGGCPRCNSFDVQGANLGECLCSHAEENSITQAAYHGVSIKDSTLYTTFSPCLICTKMIINSGIREVIYSTEYTLDAVPLKLLQEAGVKIRQLGSPSEAGKKEGDL
ncbi:MAG TPA: deaminase [Candidatus Omnitrophota bacterium]|nr:deaminase [Candidatus Omnitrophota bacterium]